MKHEKMKTGFYIGRFQPFHLGHLSVIKEALKEVDRLIIGIGSAENSFTKENPFTSGERTDMILAALAEEHIDHKKILIIPIRDIKCYGMWVSHVEMLCPKFEIIFTGSPITKMLFKEHKEYEVRDVKKTLDVCATEVREKMLNKEDWQSLLPKATSVFIEFIDGINRIKDIYEKD